MQFSALFVSFFILNNTVLCENKSNKVKRKNELAIFGYVRDFKIDQDAIAAKFPAFLITPVFIVPIKDIRRHLNKININDALSEDSSAVSDTIMEGDNDIQTNEVNSDIEVNFRQGLDRGNNSKKDMKNVKTDEDAGNDNNDDNNATTDGTTTKSETTATETTTAIEVSTQELTTILDTTTEATVTYPNAIYDNKEVTSQTITVKNPDDILYPPLENDQWKNFTSTDILKENITKPAPSDPLNITRYPSVNETDSLIEGVYPPALYNNAEIDQLSITTNSYTNGSPLPPPQDDRWRRFSSLRKMLPTSNEFKPLAGLYYDGYLHRPILKAPGFEPYNRYHFY
ncbi:uncharacterized protein LOC142977694 [Anticarsia gemmatalis]|uniref:uncharacterized protein LOC142977694 n=1 Tax=Anticarsia gemmatalis TaxID=129554 RepID=UPI003F777A2E